MDRGGKKSAKSASRGKIAFIKRELTAFIVILLFMCIFVFLFALDVLEVLSYKILLYPPLKNVSEEIVIMEMDDFPDNHRVVYRGRHGDMIKRLANSKAKAVGFDALFEGETEADGNFTDGLKYAKGNNLRVILALMPYTEKGVTLYKEPEPAFRDNSSDIGIPEAQKEKMLETIRGVKLDLSENGSGKSYHLAVLMLASSQKINESGGLLKIKGREVKVNKDLLYISFARPESFNRIKYKDAMEMADNELADKVSGKYVLIGGTVEGWEDFRKTPIGEMAGVFVVANILNCLLEDKLVRPVDMGWTILALFISSIIVLAVSRMPWFKKFWLWVFIASLIAVYLMFDRILFAKGLYMPVIYVPANIMFSSTIIHYLKRRPIYDAFISYRRAGGSEIARLIWEQLEERKKNVFMDLIDLDSGEFDRQLLERLAEANNCISILTPGCLDRCQRPGDWVRIEITEAIRLKKNIIPVMQEGFVFPDAAQLPEELRSLSRYNGIKLNMEFFDAFIDKLLKLMK